MARSAAGGPQELMNTAAAAGDHIDGRAAGTRGRRSICSGWIRRRPRSTSHPGRRNPHKSWRSRAYPPSDRSASRRCRRSGTGAPLQAAHVRCIYTWILSVRDRICMYVHSIYTYDRWDACIYLVWPQAGHRGGERQGRWRQQTTCSCAGAPWISRSM